MRLYDNDEYREEFMALVYGLLMSDGTNDRANQIIDAFDMAPSVEAEPLPPNAPLTLDELREMGGEPVWCCQYGWKICYGIVGDGDNAKMLTGCGSSLSLRGYGVGKTWLAYRRKPGEEPPRE